MSRALQKVTALAIAEDTKAETFERRYEWGWLEGVIELSLNRVQPDGLRHPMYTYYIRYITSIYKLTL